MVEFNTKILLTARECTLKISLVVLILLYLCYSSFASSWQIEIVDAQGSIGEFPSIALDSENKPHISYWDNGNNHLKYAYYDSSDWQISVVDPSQGAGQYTSLVLDSLNNPHISYYQHSGSDYFLKYAYYNGSAWEISTLTPASWLPSETSIELDNTDNPHISYKNQTNNDLVYAAYNGSEWQFSIVDSAGDVGNYSSLKLNSNDKPCISYYDSTNSALKYAQYDGTVWQISSVDSVGTVGWYTSLALDSTGNPHISYEDGGSTDLKYAHRTGSIWQITTVDSSQDVGQSCSIALNSTDHSHISYYDDTNNRLKYARYNGTSWQISVVDTGGDYGRHTSIAIDSNDDPHIAYWAYTGYDLKYAFWFDDTGVSLLSFSAQPQSGNAIKLVWQVSASDDTQIVGFCLYRADAGKAHKKDWTRLNSSAIAPHEQCQYVDASVQVGQGYQYRLSALTADGKEEMLGTTQGEAGTTPAAFALTAVYPNPTNSLLTCRLTMPQAGSVSLGLYDISGRLVLSRRLDLPTGEQETALEVGNLAKGIYTVWASSSGDSVTKRIVVMR